MSTDPLHRTLELALILGLTLIAFAGPAHAGINQDVSSTGWCRTTAEPGTILSTQDAHLAWQADGNLVLYRNGGTLLWSSGTAGQNNQLCFQGDGNLVIYDNGAFLWSTGTTEGAGSRLRLDRCSLSVRTADGAAAWDTPARCDPIRSAEIQQGWCRSTAEAAILLRTDDAYLAWQGDGNLALYDASGAHRWSSGTAGQGDLLCFQQDGNFAIFDNGQTIWDTGALGGLGTRLVLDRCTLTLFGGPSIWTIGFACTETYHDEIGTGWCRTTAQSGVILQTEDSTLAWQGDGHLALYDRNGVFRWGSNTTGQNNQLCFQGDGNLVIYENGQHAWSTGTMGGAGSRLALDDCSLSVLAGGQSLWSGGFTCAGSVNTDRIRNGWCRTTAQPGTLLQTPYATLDWQDDGNLALYDRLDGSHQWSTGTAGQADRLCFQDDGNLIIYDVQGSSLFSTHVYGAMGPTLSLNGCTLSIEGQPWSVDFDCDLAGGIVSNHNENGAWSQNGFGARYDASVAYHQPYAGFSRTVGRATVDAQVFDTWFTIVEAHASTVYSAGGNAAEGAITITGTLTPIVLTTEDRDLITPIERTFASAEGGVDLGPISVGGTSTVEGRIALTGRLTPALSGASITITPDADLESVVDASASKFCVAGGIRGTVQLIDFTMPTTVGLDMVDRVASLVGQVVVGDMSGSVEAFLNYCVGGSDWTLYDFGSDTSLVTTDFVNTSVSF